LPLLAFLFGPALKNAFLWRRLAILLIGQSNGF
jgi:hypothetical protein